MYSYFWMVFALNLLLSAGIMLTYLSRSKREEDDPSALEPSVAGSGVLVIIPAKGVDFELDKNLASIKDQDLELYDLVAVVDTADDPSVPILEKEGIGYIESTESCSNCSGKVRAIYSALKRNPEYGYYVVADSDIRVEGSWLANLLKPLSNPRIGVSTTFPVFYPDGGFWTKFKMFWGLVGQSMMESNLTRFVWGGSMAFRRELMDPESLMKFSSAISDDIAVMEIAKGKGLKISYVREARPRIYSKENFSSFMEWANRQTAFSIYGTNRTFSFGMFYYLVSIYLVLSSIVLSVFVSAVFVVFLFPYLFNSLNSQRKVPVRVWYFPLLTFILPFVYVWNLISGMIRKRVVWRGNAYSLSKD